MRAAMNPSLVLTIGHSNRSLAEFVDLLTQNGVQLLVDVRKMPRSARNPQFNFETLPASLLEHDIRSRHDPTLGGLRKGNADSVNQGWRNASFRAYADHMQTDAFKQAVDQLAELARGQTICLMCAEAVPWRCHRNLIADALLVRGCTVEHIIGPGPRRRHELPTFAVVEGCEVRYPGEPELPLEDERPNP